MKLEKGNAAFEELNARLNDPRELEEYKKKHGGYRAQWLPRMLGKWLVWCGNVVYGRDPSYLKFRSVEVIARVPYHSWVSASFTLATLFYEDEKRALDLAHTTRYARLAQDNETMHVVVISRLAQAEEKAGYVRHTLIPMFFAFFYFWTSYWLYLIRPRWSFELNYMFEGHAFEQYSRFLEKHGDELKKKPIESEYLAWYGRHPENQYEFFRSIRNDEVIHRNESIEEIDKEADVRRADVLKLLFVCIVATAFAVEAIRFIW